MVGRISAALGKPFLPWQQQVADVALEVDPETGGLWYREIDLTVPRQSGKTTLLLPVAIQRSRLSSKPQFQGRQRMLYAAQSGKDAREKWLEDFVEDMKASAAMVGLFTVRLTSGSEHVRFSDGSMFGPIATRDTSGHGKTLDLGILDEAFAQVDNRVEAAWSPAMITRKNRQLWVVSTAGTSTSIYLKSKVDKGRKLVESSLDTHSDSRVAYFEWSAEPGLDPHDPATWWSCMPALGYTVDERAVQFELDNMEGGIPAFCRAYLNWWMDGVTDPVWPAKTWLACRDERATRAGGLVLAVDTAPDRSSSCISMGASTTDGRPLGRVIQHGPGTAWVLDAVVAEYRASQAPYVVIDRESQAHSFVRELTDDHGVNVEIMSGLDMADACGQLDDSVTTEQFRHVGQQPLDDAVIGAEKRDVLAKWMWNRRSPAADITPLVSITAAQWGHSRNAQPNVY